MYVFGSFDAFIVKPTIMPDFARNLLHYYTLNRGDQKPLDNIKFMSGNGSRCV